MSNDSKGDNQPNKSVKLNLAIKMSIDRTHAILGHSSKAKTRETAAALGILSREVHSRPANHVQFRKRDRKT